MSELLNADLVLSYDDCPTPAAVENRIRETFPNISKTYDLQVLIKVNEERHLAAEKFGVTPTEHAQLAFELLTDPLNLASQKLSMFFYYHPKENVMGLIVGVLAKDALEIPAGTWMTVDVGTV